ncbi:unnamed protein product [Bursaphelenchus okinawaensis]|uniref:Beta-galactosidase n=1 Tax=Bursaphelenchus okinawaensis TaxID=465554 RepID=A0A811LDR7_9BILA|nr:unnamed protein product [Bursaphelenchus okinawaensis]CAG9120799.1 unnamed protein product [Bursaphelenchus okinawaensis]
MIWQTLLLIILPLVSSDFGINCAKNTFELDGKPFHYIAGELHYFRIPHELWRDRLERVKAMGINVAQIYIAWNYHEEQPGEFNFQGNRNVTEFIKIAEELGMYVNLRIGPYICAEWTQGGIPWWLLKYDNITLRDNKGPYWEHAKNWIKRISEEVKELQYPNGPVLLIQLENEYGSYGNHHEYMNQLVEYAQACGLKKVPLITTDGNDAGWLNGGVAKGAYPTVDFGPTDLHGVNKSFIAQRKFAKCGPNVNSEFYPGWFAAWFSGKPSYSSAERIINTMKYIREFNGSLSFYMIHGGTNWGFTQGAETDQFLTTSYDYGAPIDEAGQVGEVYKKVRDYIKSLNDPSLTVGDVPENHPTFEAQNIPLQRLAGGFLWWFYEYAINTCYNVTEPENFEKFGQAEGYAIYSHQLTKVPKLLNLTKFRNLVYVFVGDEYQGMVGPCSMSHCTNNSIELKAKKPGTLSLFVENLGRLNFQHGVDTKGILGPVLADGTALKNWSQCPIRLDQGVKKARNRRVNFSSNDDYIPGPAVYMGFPKLTVKNKPLGVHTYLDAFNLGKGQLYVESRNIGRAWPEAGPLKMSPLNFVLLLSTFFSSTTAQYGMWIPRITQEDIQKFHAEQSDRYHFDNPPDSRIQQRFNYDVQRIIQNYQNPNAPNNDNWTPLEWSDLFGSRKATAN